jgi:cysteine desulfurase / selenocysteine lyase
MSRRLYLDNAATSFPKPPAVIDAMVKYMMQVGGTAGRGVYHEAQEGGRIIAECRRRLCRYFNGESSEHIVFTLNTSDALNLAINGVIAQRRIDHPRRPIHVVATAMEHNSVLRPLNAATDVEWTCIPADPDTGLVSPGAIAAAIRDSTALVALNHASNVSGTIQPAAEVGEVCRRAGVPFLLDAAQSLGHIPVDVRAMHVDLLAFPGHKGLMGPLGTGGLYLRPGMERLVQPVRVGGTGSRSEEDTQPDLMPDRYEPGSQNAVGIAGLSAAVHWLLNRGDEVFAHDVELRTAMLDGLRELDAFGPNAGRRGWRLLGPTEAAARVGVFSLLHTELSSHEAAVLLEQKEGILARAGLHCAPRAHATFGTRDGGGALRLSFGAFSTLDDVAAGLAALESLCCSPTAV